MTPILDGSDGDFLPEVLEELEELEEVAATLYPTPWEPFKESLDSIEVRNLSKDTYQLRSSTHRIVLNQEGFDLYKDKTLQGQVIFEDWCKRHNIMVILRESDSHPVAVGKLLNGEG